jgi:hypothetical protein
MEAVERIKKALEDAGKTREGAVPTFTTVDVGEGKTERVRSCAMVELPAADLVEACDAVADPDDTVKAIRRGASSATKETVVVEAQHAFAILDAAGKKRAKHDDKDDKPKGGK